MEGVVYVNNVTWTAFADVSYLIRCRCRGIHFGLTLHTCSSMIRWCTMCRRMTPLTRCQTSTDRYGFISKPVYHNLILRASSSNLVRYRRISIVWRGKKMRDFSRTKTFLTCRTLSSSKTSSSSRWANRESDLTQWRCAFIPSMRLHVRSRCNCIKNENFRSPPEKKKDTWCTW